MLVRAWVGLLSGLLLVVACSTGERDSVPAAIAECQLLADLPARWGYNDPRVIEGEQVEWERDGSTIRVFAPDAEQIANARGLAQVNDRIVRSPNYNYFPSHVDGAGQAFVGISEANGSCLLAFGFDSLSDAHTDRVITDWVAAEPTSGAEP